MAEQFIQCTYQSMNIPRIHIKPNDFIRLVDKISDAIIFREYNVSRGNRFSLSGYAGDKEPDIFIIYTGLIISTDAPISITNLEDFRKMLLEQK